MRLLDPLRALAAMLSLAWLCAACADVAPSRLDTRFGDALREGKQAQTIPSAEHDVETGVSQAEVSPKLESYMKGDAASRARADQPKPQQGSAFGAASGR